MIKVNLAIGNVQRLEQLGSRANVDSVSHGERVVNEWGWSVADKGFKLARQQIQGIGEFEKGKSLWESV